MAESKAPRSTKRKFVADGLFLAELNEFFQRELAEEGYAGVEVRTNRLKPEIIIKATRTQNVLGERGRRIRELTSLVQQRFGFKSDGVELFAERVQNRALCAIAQAESVRYKLIEGLNVRRACYGVLRKVILGGAMGCEIVVTGKLRGQRAKAMKFRDGFMIKSGDATNHYIDSAVRHINLKQGVLGIKVKIQLPYDPEGKDGGVTIPLPDVITIKEPKEDPLATAVVPGGLDVPTTMAPGPAPVGPAPAMGTPGGYPQPEPVGVGPVPVGPAPL